MALVVRAGGASPSVVPVVAEGGACKGDESSFVIFAASGFGFGPVP